MNDMNDTKNDDLLDPPGIESFSGTHPYSPECAATVTELDWYGHLDAETVHTHAVRTTNRVTAALAEGRCPRCSDPLDPTYTAGSRVTACRCVPICPACGSDEGNQMILGHPYAPVWKWPVSKGWRTRRARKVEALRTGPPQSAILAGDSLITEDGAMTLKPRPHSGGWFEYGPDDGSVATM